MESVEVFGKLERTDWLAKVNHSRDDSLRSNDSKLQQSLSADSTIHDTAQASYLANKDDAELSKQSKINSETVQFSRSDASSRASHPRGVLERQNSLCEDTVTLDAAAPISSNTDVAQVCMQSLLAFLDS